MKWFEKAADLGSDRAQYNLGVYYEAIKKPLEAIQWYKKAAAQGNVLAKKSLTQINTSS
jgi:TPR repeat protein